MAAQRLAPIAIGFLPIIPSNGTASLALSATATWLAFGFVPDANRQVSKIRAFNSAINGVLATTDVTCDIYSDSNGVPGSSLESRSSITSSLAANTWGEWTGFTSASNVTGGLQHWAVIKNANGTPATNFPTFRFGGNTTWSTFSVVGGGLPGWGKVHSTNSGGAWGTALGDNFGWRIEYADGTFQGVPISNNATAGTNNVYSNRERGLRFTTPSNARWNIRGICWYNRTTTGTPTAGMRGRIYTGAGVTPTLVATTPTVSKTALGAQWLASWFSASQIIEPGTTMTMTMGEDTNSDTSSNRYSTTEYTVENDANSKALMPFGGMSEAYFDGTNWTFTDTILVPIGVLLDTDGEFAAVASGGLLNIGGMTGGMHRT